MEARGWSGMPAKCNARALIASAAVGWSVICVARPGHAAFTQKQCYPNTVNVPLDVGASDFNHKWFDENQYGHNQRYPWTLLVNSNVLRATWNYQNFSTEACCDGIKLDHYFGTYAHGDAPG